MSHLRIIVAVALLVAVPTLVSASEADEIREKAKAIQREAAELAEHGHKEEAGQLKRKAMAMLKEAEQIQHGNPDRRQAEIPELERLHENLRREEGRLSRDPDAGRELDAVRQKAREVELELRELVGQPHRDQERREVERREQERREVERREQDHRDRGPRGPHEEIGRRLEHMRIAVEHLNHAGLHDIANHVAEQAEAAERELHEQHIHHEEAMVHEVMKQLDEMRHEIGRLRDEVNSLRENR